MSTLSFFLENFSSFSSLLNLSFPQNLQSFSTMPSIYVSSFLLCSCFPIFGAPKWQLQLEVPPYTSLEAALLPPTEISHL